MGLPPNLNDIVSIEPGPSGMHGPYEVIMWEPDGSIKVVATGLSEEQANQTWSNIKDVLRKWRDT